MIKRKNRVFISLLSSFYIIFFPLLTKAEEPLVVENRGISIAISTAKNQDFTIQLTSPKITLKKVFNIDKPSRIVIDITGVAFDKTDPIKINSDLIKKIRLGNHKLFSRLVLDLKDTHTPQYTYTEEESSLTITVIANKKNKTVTPSPTATTPLLEVTPTQKPETSPITTPSETPTKTPSPSPSVTPTYGSDKTFSATPSTPTKTPSPSPSVTSTQTPDVSLSATPSTPTKTPSPSPSVTPTYGSDKTFSATPSARPEPQITETLKEKPSPTSSSKIALNAILFNHDANGAPLLAFNLTAKSRFSLNKTGEKEYTLSIQNCTVEKEHLKLPYFPPQDFKGLTLIQVTDTENEAKLNIKIHTEVNTKITALPSGTEILIKVLE
ncbi:MAG: AMIN domain-containing protein [Bdellovibrionota bacterium]|jgi:hypothetical protein